MCIVYLETKLGSESMGPALYVLLLPRHTRETQINALDEISTHD